MLRRRRASTVLATLAAIGACCAGCSDDAESAAATDATTRSSSAPDAFTPLVGRVDFAPVPFVGSDGKTHLVYELSLVNFTQGETALDSLAVVDADTGTVVDDLDATEVHQRLQPAGGRDSVDALGPGEAGTVFLHVTLDEAAAVPRQLVHRVTSTADAAPPEQRTTTAELGETTVDERTLPVLAAPLRGERFVAADGCCDASRHTRALLPLNGRTFVAQRYAIDYEQADDQLRIFTGDPADPDSYRIFGAQVHAVADGTVVATRNDLPEQVPGTYPAGIALDEADGNFVVLDIGDGFYVNYAHMQPGSVRVGVGDRVSTGEVIGLVGNTGNSVAPHLHLHVMDGPSPLASQGLPYLNEKFVSTGQVASTADFDAAEGTGIPLVTVPGVTTTEHTDQLVLDQNIVTFE